MSFWRQVSNGRSFEEATEWTTHQPTRAQRVIGRSDDLKPFHGQEGFNTYRDSRKGWEPTANRAWIQKGIDRGETFRVASPDPWNPKTLWNDPLKVRVGTATPFAHELMWLLEAGYVYRDGFMVPTRFMR
jgi:hypothetical protein